MDYFVHNIDPIVFTAGPITVRWYGLMYLVGFTCAFFILNHKNKKGLFALNSIEIQDLITHLLAGMIIGARFVYVLIYNPEILDGGWWKLFAVWEGGLSYHGAMLGFCGAMYIFGRKNNVGFLHLADYTALGASFGVFFGRIGNFINGELFGRVTDVPWAVVFPGGGAQPRHPSQLYQALGEGLIVFFILLLVERREVKKGFAPDPNAEPLKLDKSGGKKSNDLDSPGSKSRSRKGSGKKGVLYRRWDRTGVMASAYVIGYGVSRIFVENYRQPDPQLGYYFGFITMGQILCSLMILLGIVVVYHRTRRAPIPQEFEVNSAAN